MPRRTLFGFAFLVLFSPLAFCQSTESSSLPKVVANDNRTPAGKLKNGVLELKLVLSEGSWYPEAEVGSHRNVYAFAEEDRAPQSSGPLIRVFQGTQIHLRIRNSLPLEAGEAGKGKIT